MLLTGMHYPDIKKALKNQKIKWQDFTCEGMGCKHYARGSGLSPEFRDEEKDCPYSRPANIQEPVTIDDGDFQYLSLNGLRKNKEYLKIDSHCNLNLYPAQLQNKRKGR